MIATMPTGEAWGQGGHLSGQRVLVHGWVQPQGPKVHFEYGGPTLNVRGSCERAKEDVRKEENEDS